ncbi:hypothetical protein LY90DRAFT_384935 [Neocallimastix californiae]|uniref:ABC transporter domain-containing protein n=1 Tax=Neocallimastix californiae TaxID=1754190 RepID=A0A1Y2CD61_9FUNG|nr:hypothetical protein LY90DRAFT_384935 [Neocallimastix californiae]|eukprot:ORY44991.1 hypothetical protein LY90DRAFT_384935 [Neocallimastix californiae]
MLFTAFINGENNIGITQEKGPSSPISINKIFQLKNYTSTHQKPIIGFVLPEDNPDDNIIHMIMNNDILSGYHFKHFKDRNQMNDYYYENHEQFLLAGVIFESRDYFQYTIRVNDTLVPKTTAKRYVDDVVNQEIFNMNNNLTEPEKYLNIFTPLQVAIDQSIIRLATRNDNFIYHPYIGEFGKPLDIYYINDLYVAAFPYFISVSYAFICIMIINSIVLEKEKGIKETLLLSGVYPSVFWLSWFVIYAALFTVISLILTVLYIQTKTLSNVNPIFVFLSILFYGFSLIILSFYISCFFHNTKTSGVVSSIIIISFCCSELCISFLNRTQKVILSFPFSPIAFGSFIMEANNLKLNDQTLSLTNIFHSSAGTFFICIFLNNLLYLLLLSITDRVNSGENNLYHYFSKKFLKKEIEENSKITYLQDIEEDFQERSNKIPAVEVCELYKVYKRKRNWIGKKYNKNRSTFFTALNNVSFKVYQDEIFSILGHNGAGKTSLIKIMAGAIKASKGTVLYEGKDINSNTQAVRENFGVCTQNNVIYDELTVEQHLKFYAELKNVNVNIYDLLKEVDLLEYRNKRAINLSGGQKRELSIAIAILGNPKFIFLDEPTTSLDPLSRRKIWYLIQKLKKGRVIFLTTHYMEEADILADRKLILNEGKIRCLGTSLYLKNHFNMNYNLEIETDDVKKVEDLIHYYIPEAKYVQPIVREEEEEESHQNFNEYDEEGENLHNTKYHTWKLPLNSTIYFESLFNELESVTGKNKLIKYHGLTMPTLEELFINLQDHSQESYTDASSSHNKKLRKRGSAQQTLLNMQQRLPHLKPIEKRNVLHKIRILIKYRFKIYLNDKSFGFSAIIAPFLMSFIIFFTVKKALSSVTEQPSEIISLQNLYPQDYLNYDIWNSSPNITYQNVYSPYLSSNGLNKEEAKSIIKALPLSGLPSPKTEYSYYIASFNNKVLAPGTYNIDVYYNSSVTHAIPVTINAISNAILESKNITQQIKVQSHPFTNYDQNKFVICLLMCTFIIISIFIAVTKFGPLIVRERTNYLVQQLELKGVSRTQYWIACLITDSLIYLFACFLIFLPGFILKFDPIYNPILLIMIVIGLLIWLFPTILHQYVLSFIFDNEDTAFTYLFIINYYTLLVGFCVATYIDNPFNTFNILQSTGAMFSSNYVRFNVIITILCPSYGICGILYSIFFLYLFNDENDYELSIKNLFKLNNNISPLFMTLVLLFLFLFILLVYLDSHQQKRSYRILKSKNIRKTSSKSFDKSYDQTFNSLVKPINVNTIVQSSVLTSPSSTIVTSPSSISDQSTYISPSSNVSNTNSDHFSFDQYSKSSKSGSYPRFQRSTSNSIYPSLNKVMISKENFEDYYPAAIAQKYREEMEMGDSDVKKEYEYVRHHFQELPFSAMHVSKEFKCQGMFDRETKEYIKQKKLEDLRYDEPHLSYYSNKIVKTVLGDVNFGLRYRECLGLLGPNGAGKSTLLNIFTGGLVPTTGQVYYQGGEIIDPELGVPMFGYCPQNDILWKELTLRDHIKFFLQLRGYENEDAQLYATQFINTCGLEEHQNKQMHYLSGGTKRKLSLILAICNFPKIILLDEPTAGIDPSTRRLIWNIILEVKERNNSSIILTTHSIDEASYLCERIGILVNGRLRYIGSSENLKMKYGNSYILEVQSDLLDAFHQEIIERACLFEQHPFKMERLSINRVKYEIQFTGNKNIGHIFYIMEKCKSSHLISDYSFSQTTLEQVFLNFSKNQINDS